MTFFARKYLPLVATLGLVTVVFLSSCSKKDVVQDEPAISPSGTTETESSGMTAQSEEYVGTGSAGDSSAIGAVELKTAYFGFDSYALTSEARDALKSNADWLKANRNANVQIEGHCDERGTTEYNLALGERRANAVKDYLSRLGVEKGRLSVISYGEERPADPGHDEAAWGRNRRAQFVILSK